MKTGLAGQHRIRNFSEFYEAVNNSTANLLSVSCLNWGVQPNYGAALYGLCPVTSATNDNGTLQSATFEAGGPGYPQFLVMNQSFNYDKLNRLTSATDSGGWSRTFNYDQAGNLWVTNPVGGPWSGSTPTTNAFTNNRINGASYDPAGNQLLVNGDTLAYDAENRQSAATDNTTHVTQKYLYDVGAQTNSVNSVFINSKGPYMTYSPTPGQAGPFGVYWTQAQFRGFILLHELGHQLSPITGFQADAGPGLLAINQAQSRRVIGACF